MADGLDISGNWEGSYAYSSIDLGALEFRLRMKDDGGALRGIIVEKHTERDGNRKADVEGSRNGREVEFVKNYVEDGSSTARPIIYRGMLSADGNEMSGSWFLPDDRGTFSIQRAS